jgi:hypothetical protein
MMRKVLCLVLIALLAGSGMAASVYFRSHLGDDVSWNNMDIGGIYPSLTVQVSLGIGYGKLLKIN